MRFTNLPEWLAWQERLHPNAIDLGLDRVRKVLTVMGLEAPTYRVLTVGGTNGKGSCAAYAEAMLRAAGYRVGCYTSPHLLRYNERVRVDGEEATDAEFCEAFGRVDAARGETSLTYFEFGTLAALHIFARRSIDAAVLEVGMGGRLDAVNVLDPDAAIVASVGLDHQDWLGPDRESIGFEKAGIYRGARPALCGDREPPASLLKHAQSIGAKLQVLGRDFEWREEGTTWSFRGSAGGLERLPPPALAGRIQYDNAATVIAALMALGPVLPVSAEALAAGLMSGVLPARFQRIPGPVECILDVAHNPDAARVLAENLGAAPTAGRTYGVVGMFKDKLAEEVARSLAPRLDRWFLGSLEGSRGQTAEALGKRIRAAVPEAEIGEYGSVGEAHAAAHAASRPGDRLVVFGSFHTVSEILKLYSPRAV